MIRGETRNVAKPMIGYKNIDEKVTYAPYQIDIRNAEVDDTGNLVKRNGYSQKHTLSLNEMVHGLIPKSQGYAITNLGKIFHLSSTPEQITSSIICGTSRPQWKVFDNDIYIASGSNMLKIDNSRVITQAEGSPPGSVKYIGRVGAYTLLAGYDDTEFSWSASNNPENWETGDSGQANVAKTGRIMYATDYANKWYIFKDDSIELWYNRGGSTPFVRLNESSVWDRGLGASYSVVEANNILYFFGNDGDFYMLNGNQVQSISNPYRAYFDGKLKNPKDLYGFDCRKETTIRWFSPVDGLCIKYDYSNGIMSEDNRWVSGGWQMLPWNSYMELDNEQYFGDLEPTGLIHKWDKSYKDDNGTAIRVYRDFRVKLDPQAGKSARINRIRWVFKSGVATATVIAPVFTYRTQLDGGSWSPWNQVDLGKLGDNVSYVDSDPIGVGHEIRIQIAETDAVDFILQDIFMTARVTGN